MALAVTLVVAVVVFLLIGAILAQLEGSHKLVRHRGDQVRAFYLAESGINVILRALAKNPGTSLDDLVARYGHCTLRQGAGYQVWRAGDYLLSEGWTGQPTARAQVQVRLVAEAYNHVLVAEDELEVHGNNPALTTPPHQMVQGTIVRPTSGFYSHYSALARKNGIYLPADPAQAEFRPGGGTWERIPLSGGRIEYRYLGGGEGESYGWTPGSTAWFYDGNRTWISTHRDSWTFSGGTWTYSGNFSSGQTLSPQQGTGGRVLSGVLFFDRADYHVTSDTIVNGSIVVYGEELKVDKAALWVVPEGPAPTLAVVVVADSGDPDAEIDIEGGNSLLTVGKTENGRWDGALVKGTGGLVYAEGEFEKEGQKVNLAGVLMADEVEINGAAASSFLFDGRVSESPPVGFEAPQLGVGRELVVGEVYGLGR